MVNQNPEQLSRDKIDERLTQAGWTVIDYKKLDWSKGTGLAVREYPTEVGPADYVLFVDRKPVGIVEAKRDDEGHRLTAVEEQSAGYAMSKLKHLNNSPLPFRYEATGIITRFTDIRDPKPRSREVFGFHRPETLLDQIKDEKNFRSRLFDIPLFDYRGMRDCQVTAIKNLEKSFQDNKPRALIQMATGAGKTVTAITSIYRLLKFAKAKRILFLVDTKNLGEQAEQEFMAYTPKDDSRKFTELYNVTRLKSRHVPTDSQVYISTIQRLYSILRERDLDEAAEDVNPFETRPKDEKPVDVAYNRQLPLEFFEVIIIDECHRSIYNLWRQVLEYFDSFLVGLTATPDKRTFGFFKENIVSEYSHHQAVTDGVNVSYDLYRIETEIGSKGAKIEQDELVAKRERLSRKIRWEETDEPIDYTAKQLDRDVVNESQIRNVIKTFRTKLPEIFPGRSEPPKTLVFAKTDSHADDIIKVIREEFGEGNEFCKKITYQAEEDPKSVLTQFRNNYNPRIAVTVDMIATGTDVRPLECLIFMRDVKSKNYYEQMLGRGTRIMSPDDLKKITPSSRGAKTHFVVVDAVGVSESQKTEVRPLDKKKSVPLKNLLQQVLMGVNDEEVYSSLASRLARLDQELSPQEENQFRQLAKGNSPSTIARALLDAHDPDLIEAKARGLAKVSEDQTPSEAALSQVKEELTRAASGMLSGELNDFIEKVRQAHEQVIDTVNIDRVVRAEWDQVSKDNSKALITEFEAFLEAHKNEITALKIYYSEPHRRREVTHQLIKELVEALKINKPGLAPLRVYEAYASLDKIKGTSPQSDLIAVVSMLRRVAGIDKKLTDYVSVVDKNFAEWVFKKQSGKVKFSKDQMAWLHMIKDHIAASFHIEQDDFDYVPFNSHGGLAKMYELFGDQMAPILTEMNEVLVA